VLLSIAEASSGEIDRLNILQATLLAMRRAVDGPAPQAEALVLVDGNRLPTLDRCRPRPWSRGDALVPAISAASILAKVHRDRWCAAGRRAVAAVRLCRAQGLRHGRAHGRLREHGACDSPPAQLWHPWPRCWPCWPVPGCRLPFHCPPRQHRHDLKPAPLTVIPISRDNALAERLASAGAGQHGAYRKQGRVWLEGDHLCSAALAARRGSPAIRSCFQSLFGL
jgi:hypothetical protein